MSSLIVNHLTNTTSERPLSAGGKAEGEARSGSGRHVVLFFSEHCLAMQQIGYHHHRKVIRVMISGQRALLRYLSLHRLKKARHQLLLLGFCMEEPRAKGLLGFQILFLILFTYFAGYQSTYDRIYYKDQLFLISMEHMLAVLKCAHTHTE